MALADIAQKILAEIDAQVKVLEKDFAAKKSALDAASTEKESAALAELSGKTDKALADVEHKIAAMARQENKKALLQARRNVLDSAMSTFLAALENGDKSTKEAVYKKLLSEIDETDGQIHVAANDEAIVKPLVKNLKVMANKDITGGFILHTGGAEVDNTFKNLVYSVYRDELEMYFADQLKLLA